jgi:hypothetical protein
MDGGGIGGEDMVELCRVACCFLASGGVNQITKKIQKAQQGRHG